MKKFHLVLILTAAAVTASAQGLQYEPPLIPGFEPPFQSPFSSLFSEKNPRLLKNNGKMFSDTAAIDFEKRQLTFMRIDENGNAVWQYHYGEMSDYISDRKSMSFYEAWYEKLTAETKSALKPPPPPRLQWELAVHYPPWAQRLLGNEPPRLRIRGRLSLTVAYDYTRVWTSKDDVITNHVPLDFNPQYEFSLTGSVGRLISVSITHSRQDGFDFSDDPLKNFKVEYKESYPGELEDEIIQEIVAGYMGFDMPGTSLSGYSEKHDGLFGLRVRAKLGPLMLTGVASHAQGEALSKELGGRNDPNSMTALRESGFIRNRYFFLDTVYRDYYNSVNNLAQPDRNAPRPPRITDFQAFVSINCGETANSTTLRYKADIDGSQVCFRMLVENNEYTVDMDRGFVRFDYNVRDEEIVAIAMRTADGSLNKGIMVPVSAVNNSEQTLWPLKPHSMEMLNSSHPNFGLMWRNVYFMSEIDDGLLDLFFFDPAQGDTVRHTGEGSQSQLISRVMGLTDEQGRARLENVEIFNMAGQELIIPPWGRGLNGNEPFANPALGGMADSTMYRHGQKTTVMRDYVSKFGIQTSGSTRRTSYDNLGWNILPGTVTVKTNTGTLLIEGEDYELDYEMGILDLLSTRARAAESIHITYQRESDFVLDRKVFAGLRGEMRLPFISDNSFMAASVLYQNAATSAEDIPQLGNEPFSKLHLSFNTSLDFEPEWMTKAVNALPLVKAEEPSAAKVDFEIVHSRMNSNTSKDGNAYLDDFERTKDGYTLSLRHLNWHHSHFPFKYTGGVEGIEREMRTARRIPAWDTYWFTPNPYDDNHRINHFSVWTRDRHNSRQNNTDTYIDVLRLHVTPASRDHPIWVRNQFNNTYAAITTSFGRNGLNMENHRYLEMVVNPRGTGSGRRGKLMVQIGTFSHDQVRDGGAPNGKFDLEDPTYQNRPELLSQFDHGLNGNRVEEKFYLIPSENGSGWDTLSRDRNPELLVSPRGPNNPSGDLFRRYDRDNLTNFRFVNGTWGNSLYDDENIDRDGIPRILSSEHYYSYTIELDSVGSPYIDPTSRVVEANGWRFYRIPIKDILESASVLRDTVGAPDWSRVRGMRLVWYDFDEQMSTSEHQLQIAGLELVGNYWEPALGSVDKIEPTSISNDEDINYHNSVYGTIVRPKAGESTPKEQSLRLRFFDLASGETALVRRNISYNPQNISGYDSVSIMVHPAGSNVDDLKFVFRFGSDDSTFYEFSSYINDPGSWNRFAFSLQALSDLKLRAEEEHDGADAPINFTSGQLRIVARPNRWPNFTTITFMAIGVTRGANGPASGEIWVNELTATGAKVLTGLAARLNLATQWSDFLSLSAGAAYTDGDFRTMTAATFGENRSEFSANVNAKVLVSRFLPEEWGVSIPVGGSISGALSRPTVRPQSDILLGSPDGLFDMAGDAFNMMFGREAAGEQTRSQRFETFTTTRNAYTSFEKTAQSENPLIGFTFDRIKTDISYNMTASRTGRGPHENPDSADYLRTDTVITYAGNLRYDLSPRNPPAWTSATPLAKVEWMPPFYKKYKLNLLPSTINFDLAEVQHRTEKRDDHRLNVYNFTTRTIDMRHGVRIDYTPIDPLLNLGYASRWDRDLSDMVVSRDWDVTIDSTLPDIFGLNRMEGEKWSRYGMLHGERGRTQTASARLSPQFVSWFTHSVDYSASYTGQSTRRDGDSAQFLNAGVGTSLRFRNSLLLNDFFKKFMPAPPPGGSRGARPAAADTSKAAADSSDTSKAPAGNKGFMERLAGRTTKLNLRTISFEYDVSTDLRNSFLTSTYLADTLGMSSYDFFKYQLGMHRSFNNYLFGDLGDGLGWMQFREMTGVSHEFYRFDQSRGSWSARLSTSFTIPDPIKVNISNVSVGWGREFLAQPDTSFIDTTIVLPEVRVSANTEALTGIGFIKRRFSKLNTSSSASYKRTRRETRDRTDTTTTLEFMPLVSLDGKFHKWPALSANYRYSRGNTWTTSGGKGESSVGLSEENTTRNSHAVTTAYEFKGGIGKLRELKIWRWAIPVEGKMNVGCTVNLDMLKTRTKKIGDDDYEIKRESDLKYSPFAEYKFTENIKGQVRYLGSHKNQNGRRTLQQWFGLTVEVTF